MGNLNNREQMKQKATSLFNDLASHFNKVHDEWAEIFNSDQEQVSAFLSALLRFIDDFSYKVEKQGAGRRLDVLYEAKQYLEYKLSEAMSEDTSSDNP